EPAFSTCQPSSHYTPDAFQPVQLCFNQGLAASSPSPADLPSPWSYSCSPPQLSPLTPLTPSPPSALDTKPYSCPVEEWPCQPPCPFPSPACCCAACGSQSTDSRLPQCLPCPSTDSRLAQCLPCPSTDCMELLPPLALAEDFFRRDRSCDICYS
ncbi:COLC2 protein, partial [Vireo altiloquus]|nr:COLC2 protein [Vireo altiloquus]